MAWAVDYRAGTAWSCHCNSKWQDPKRAAHHSVVIFSSEIYMLFHKLLLFHSDWVWVCRVYGWKGLSDEYYLWSANCVMLRQGDCLNCSYLSCDQICWLEIWLQTLQDAEGNVFARGLQHMKCVSMQSLEVIWNLKSKSFQPLDTLYLSFVPEEETGGHDGARKFITSPEFQKINVGFNLWRIGFSRKHIPRFQWRKITLVVGHQGHRSTRPWFKIVQW